MKLASVFIAVGAIALALAAPRPRESAPDASGRIISMGHEVFGRSKIAIHAGDRLTFANGSAWLHVLIPGKGARLATQPGIPSFGARDAHLSEHSDRWLTGAWTVPGTYFITCQLHPEMLLEVHVLPSRSTAPAASAHGSAGPTR